MYCICANFWFSMYLFDIAFLHSPGKMSSKMWLSKHGLAAKKLTILDALAPTFIPHSPKYVPIINKNVLSKVFDDVSMISLLLLRTVSQRNSLKLKFFVLRFKLICRSCPLPMPLATERRSASSIRRQ